MNSPCKSSTPDLAKLDGSRFITVREPAIGSRIDPSIVAIVIGRSKNQALEVRG